MKKLTIGITTLCLSLAACQSLDITNLNEPDRRRALSNAEDVEALIASAWRPYWARTQSQGWPYYALTSIAAVHTTSEASSGALTLSVIPRPAYDNNPTSDVAGLARFPWYELYSGLDNANEGLTAIEDGLRIMTPVGPGTSTLTDNTARARAFAKFSQGLMLGYIGMMYDKGFIAKEGVDWSDPDQRRDGITLRPYEEVIAAAIESMNEAIAICEENTFTLPGAAPDAIWISGLDLTNEDLAKLAHSFIARFLVLSARSPEDREVKVDWDAVLHHTEKGITADWIIPHDKARLESPNFKRRIQYNAASGYRLSYFFIGTADVSGNFQRWLATPLAERERFLITTPDRRLTGNTPTSSGSYARYLSGNLFRAERGLWRWSHYQFYRWRGAWEDAPALLMSVTEMNLLRAEAYLRKGMRPEAAGLINITRVANGKLPPVTEDGVPESPTCVPRTYEGACETLLGALMYERIWETTGLESPRDWLDSRGFGRLIKGTFIQLPVPGRELENLGLPIYTFGGSNPGSAP
jgi:hypothetical protein